MIAKYLNIWTEKSPNGGTDNALATATRAAVAGQRQCITYVVAGYTGDAAAGKVLTIYDGATVKLEVPFLTNPVIVALPGGSPLLRGTKAGAVSATLEASGTAGVKGYVNIGGFADPNG